MEAFKEKTVGFVMVAGIAIAVIAGIAMCMFIGGGVLHGTITRTPGTDQITDPGDLNLMPIAFFFLVVGLAMTGGGIAYALWQHSTRHSGARQAFQQVRVIARYGYNKDWHMITADWELEQAEDPHYFVRIELGPGDLREFECAPETYYQCGEGMFGEVEVQGKWLGKFVPFIGMPGSRPPV